MLPPHAERYVHTDLLFALGSDGLRPPGRLRLYRARPPRPARASAQIARSQIDAFQSDSSGSPAANSQLPPPIAVPPGPALGDEPKVPWTPATSPRPVIARRLPIRPRSFGPFAVRRP